MNWRNWQRPLALLVAVALGAGAWRAGQWKGIALLGSGLLFWGLLYFNRLVTVMKRASDRPVGYVGSAVMLNAKLQAGQNLLTVVALTGAIGERLSEPEADPEAYRWSDPGQSSVTAEFRGGKLACWRLERPQPQDLPEPAQPH